MSRPVDPAAGFVPAAVRDTADELRAATKHEPEIVRTGDRRFRIVMTNDRVHMTVDYKMIRPGRWTWATSTLEVDGNRRELAENQEEFVKIFLDPDYSAASEEVPPPTPDPMPEPRPIDDAPPIVQTTHKLLTDRLGDRAEIQAGGDDHCWTLGITAERATLRLHFDRDRARWRMRHKRPFQIIVDGVDRTDEVGNDLARAMELFAGRPGSPSAALPGITAPRQAARNMGVEVRRQTVIRT